MKQINYKTDLIYLKKDQVILLTKIMMKIQAVVVQGDGEGEETMVLHQDPCRQMYLAETLQQKILDELRRPMMKDFK